MTDIEKKLAARQFVKNWLDRGDEKQDTQQFWSTLLHKVYGVESPEQHICFEKRVVVDNMSNGKSTTKFIDAYLPETRVLIEQKSADIDLEKGEKQSDGSILNPYQQARRYGGYLSNAEQPRWIVVCNFREFHIHDMNNPNAEPEILLLKDMEKEFYRLNFLICTQDDKIKKEMQVSIAAGEIVRQLYEAFEKQYKDPENEYTQKSLNKLCVRLVFCLYAEDAGIFGRHGMFHDYLEAFDVRGLRRAMVDLFRVLNTEEDKRDPYLKEDNPRLVEFPYVNGGLFSGDDIEIPPFTEEIRELLLDHASTDFDWSEISPTIFGAVFESTLNPETRRKGGMHYTSIENIHKVIDPLFLNDLKDELAQILQISVDRTRNRKLEEFQKKLASLTFLDPACGSGNFLTETYLSLRRMENQVIDALNQGQVVMGGSISPIRVSIQQFYGIEINDFAVTVAKTALWIAESQMMKETEAIVHEQLNFLPLKTNAYIIEGNALRTDWETIVPKRKLSYIMGNPPFVGARLMGPEQKNDLNLIFEGWKNAGNLDYVCCWYKKCADIMRGGGSIKSALVSTNSVVQGESVANLWKPLFEEGIRINYGYRTFRWDSEAASKAHVHCVIIGFSIEDSGQKYIYSENGAKSVSNINAYLMDAPDVFVESRNKPLCDVPQIGIGNKPIDGGFYLFSKEEMDEFIQKEPMSKQYFHPWYGAREFINNQPRYCLYLAECSPEKLKYLPESRKRVEEVRQYRLRSTSAGTRKLADVPTRFHVTNIPKGAYIVIPQVSSERRKYIPMGYMDENVMCSDKVRILPDGTLYHFGILESNVHMAWMRTVCCRLKSDYSYTVNDVYNNFPWPMPTETQKQKIERTAQAILDARALYPECSLAAV